MEVALVVFGAFLVSVVIVLGVAMFVTGMRLK